MESHIAYAVHLERLKVGMLLNTGDKNSSATIQGMINEAGKLKQTVDYNSLKDDESLDFMNRRKWKLREKNILMDWNIWQR